MSESKYHALDTAICGHIAREGGHPIYSSILASIARPLLAKNKTPFPEEWRLIDRRMQAMRKAGRLEYVRKKGGGPGGWQVVDA